MNLAKSVDRYTSETLTDPYGIGGSIKGKFSVFDDEKSSGVATLRRVLETLPTYTMYSSNCVKHNDTVYIVGSPSYDFHKNYAVRVKYPVIPCPKTYFLGTVKELIDDNYSKDDVFAFVDLSRAAVADSETTDAVNILVAYLPALQAINKGDILFNSTEFYRVKGFSVIDGAGFQNVELTQLDTPLNIVTFTQKSGYDVATDSIVNATVLTGTTVFIEDAYYYYDRTSSRYNKIEPGDKNITLSVELIPKAGDTIGDYKILSVDTTYGGAYSCHCRL